MWICKKFNFNLFWRFYVSRCFIIDIKQDLAVFARNLFDVFKSMCLHLNFGIYNTVAKLNDFSGKNENACDALFSTHAHTRTHTH